MHDLNTHGAGKPVQSCPGTPRAQSKSGRGSVEDTGKNHSTVGSGAQVSSRNYSTAALADPFPTGQSTQKGVQLSGPPLRVRFFAVDAEEGIGLRSVGHYLIAKDVCDALEISKHKDAIAGLEDYMRGPLVTVQTRGGPQAMATVTEPGFYALATSSRRTDWAKRFAKKVYTEILPEIRRTGSYSVTSGPTLAELASNPTYLPLAAGHGSLALLPRATGAPVPDLATEHVQQLLSRLIGEKEAQWIGRMPEIAEACVRWNLFFWLIRDAADLTHRSRLGLLLSRRAGINYLGYGQTHLQIRTVGRNRHRKYVIVRLEGGAA